MSISSAMRYGWGCFETIRIHENDKIAFLDEHIDRLQRACHTLRIKTIPCQQIEELVRERVARNNIKSVRVLRIVVAPDIPVQISIESYSNPLQEAQLTVNRVWRIDSTSPLNQFKSFNYLKNHMAYLEARDAGFDEAILLNENGIISECTRSNIFYCDGEDNWYTPCLSTGCLGGIVRGHMMTYLNAKESEISSLVNYKHILITNSLIEILPVNKVDEHQYDILSGEFISGAREYLSSF